LALADQKGQHQAQGLLRPEAVQRRPDAELRPARGLLWMTLARDQRHADETWIKES